jgi:hypothetical protein
MDWTAKVQSPAEVKDISSGLHIQTGSGAHTASYPVGTVSAFPSGKVWPYGDPVAMRSKV